MSAPNARPRRKSCVLACPGSAQPDVGVIVRNVVGGPHHESYWSSTEYFAAVKYAARFPSFVGFGSYSNGLSRRARALIDASAAILRKVVAPAGDLPRRVAVQLARQSALRLTLLSLFAVSPPCIPTSAILFLCRRPLNDAGWEHSSHAHPAYAN